MSIIAHTMQYVGGKMPFPSIALRNYLNCDYIKYKKIYNSCFADMRCALGLYPVDCCDTRETLLNKSENIFIFEIENQLVGSVAIYNREIDDLIVARECQRKGYGQGLLQFAVAHMQRMSTSPIMLHVADWNHGAIELYTKNGFRIVKTEAV